MTWKEEIKKQNEYRPDAEYGFNSRIGIEKVIDLIMDMQEDLEYTGESDGGNAKKYAIKALTRIFGEAITELDKLRNEYN